MGSALSTVAMTGRIDVVYKIGDNVDRETTGCLPSDRGSRSRGVRFP